MDQAQSRVGAQVRSQEPTVALWVGVVLVSAIVAVIASGVSSDRDATSAAISALRVRLQKAEAANDALKTQLEKQAEDFRTIAQSEAFDILNSEEFATYVKLEKDKYQNIGPFWQVTGLELGENPQGCVLRGRILGKLAIGRQNMHIKVELLSNRFNSRGSGSGVLQSLIPGHYSAFSIVIPTDSNLVDVELIRISIDQGTGTTSAVY